MDAFYDMDGVDVRKAAPKNKRSLSYIVHNQDWSAFNDQGYTIREVRSLGNRIKEVDNMGNHRTGPVSYQQIIRRIMQGLMWFGRPDQKQLITAKYQNFSSWKS